MCPLLPTITFTNISPSHHPVMVHWSTQWKNSVGSTMDVFIGCFTHLPWFKTTTSEDTIMLVMPSDLDQTIILCRCFLCILYPAPTTTMSDEITKHGNVSIYIFLPLSWFAGQTSYNLLTATVFFFTSHIFKRNLNWIKQQLTKSIDFFLMFLEGNVNSVFGYIQCI